MGPTDPCPRRGRRGEMGKSREIGLKTKQQQQAKGQKTSLLLYILVSMISEGKITQHNTI